MKSQPVLQIRNAVAAILRAQDDGYVLQLRDDVPHIWYPGHWGLFGGSVDPGEDELAALRRELYEELELEIDVPRARLFTRLQFDLQPLGFEQYFRSYYEIAISDAEIGRLVLHEGAAMRTVAGDEMLAMKLVPYDAFALFLHHRQTRLTGSTV
ncbi:MAG TPA: NUDIX domain-containing protein [Pseudolabrys sp.]|jgi:8-oxo-dGTP pyrophosphatase MutT (NUDIX family)